MTPNPVKLGQTVTFNGSTSSDPDGTIAKYEWDLDGNGTYETDTGTNPRRHAQLRDARPVDVRLRVTDNLTGTDTETRTLNVGNQAPTASFTATPNPAVVDQPTAFNASASSDPDGTIAKYEWDLDGNGTYETDTGTTATTTKTYAAPGTSTSACASPTTAATTATTTLARHGQQRRRSQLRDTRARHARPRRATGAWATPPGRRSPTARARTTRPPRRAGVRRAGRRRRRPEHGQRASTASTTPPVRTSTSRARARHGRVLAEVEPLRRRRRLAMEFTELQRQRRRLPRRPERTAAAGPSASASGAAPRATTSSSPGPAPARGTTTRSSSTRRRRRATQITPYVDGAARRYTKLDSGTGAGTSPTRRCTSCRAQAASLFGAGDLDEVAVYNRALSAATIAEHYALVRHQPPPDRRASRSRRTRRRSTRRSPSDATGSTRPRRHDRQVRVGPRRQRQATRPTRARPTASRARTRRPVTGSSAARHRQPRRHGRRTEDALVANTRPPRPSRPRPNPAIVGQTVTFNGSASSDPDGTIAKYEWDLDGNGTFETDTGTTATTSRVYANAAHRERRPARHRRRRGDGHDDVARSASSRRSYPNAILATPGLATTGAWRSSPARPSRTARARAPRPPPGAWPSAARARSPATEHGGQLRRRDRLGPGEPRSLRVHGGDGRVLAQVGRLRRRRRSSPWSSRRTSTRTTAASSSTRTARTATFGVAHRPRRVAQHDLLHAAERRPVAPLRVRARHRARRPPRRSRRTSTASPSRTPRPRAAPAPPNFANSTLYFMSRGGASLFGAGDLDEVAIYDGALSAATVAEHYADGTP